MSYHKAKEMFNDNFNYIKGSTDPDPVMHNLSAGLFQLSEVLEADMTKIRRSLSEIAISLRRLEQK